MLQQGMKPEVEKYKSIDSKGGLNSINPNPASTLSHRPKLS